MCEVLASTNAKNEATESHIKNWKSPHYITIMGNHSGTVVKWLSLLHNFIHQSLNAGSAQAQNLLAVCQRFTMKRISDNDPGWK